MAKMTGRVTTVNIERGYAIVTGDVDQRRYFCFVNYFDEMSYFRFEDLRGGEPVRFEPIEGPRGPRGVDVRILGDGLATLDGM